MFIESFKWVAYNLQLLNLVLAIAAGHIHITLDVYALDAN
jgi:hypothetical protein